MTAPDETPQSQASDTTPPQLPDPAPPQIPNPAVKTPGAPASQLPDMQQTKIPEGPKMNTVGKLAMGWQALWIVVVIGVALFILSQAVRMFGESDDIGGFGEEAPAECEWDHEPTPEDEALCDQVFDDEDISEDLSEE